MGISFQKEGPEDDKSDLMTFSLNVSPNAELHENTFTSSHGQISSNILPDSVVTDSFSSIFEQSSSSSSSASIRKIEDQPGQTQGHTPCIMQQDTTAALPTSKPCFSQAYDGLFPNKQNVPLRRIGNGRPKF